MVLSLIVLFASVCSFSISVSSYLLFILWLFMTVNMKQSQVKMSLCLKLMYHFNLNDPSGINSLPIWSRKMSDKEKERERERYEKITKLKSRLWRYLQLSGDMWPKSLTVYPVSIDFLFWQDEPQVALSMS